MPRIVPSDQDAEAVARSLLAVPILLRLGKLGRDKEEALTLVLRLAYRRGFNTAVSILTDDPS